VGFFGPDTFAENYPIAQKLTYPIVDTGQDRCFSANNEIAYPKSGNAFYGQDAQFQGLQPSYKDNGNGTISDLNTGLMWVKTPDLKNKKTFDEAVSGAAKCRVGGYDDWRLPSIKELYSLIDFRGYSARTQDLSKPYIDTRYFDFVFGDERSGERLIDAQYWSATEYVGLTMDGNKTVFGVNFADGRIKGYPKYPIGRKGAGKHFTRYVRGNPDYGKNDFQDNRNGTVTDKATGLVWTKSDSGRTMNWENALAWVQKKNKENYLGHNDWRLPNAKELQSIVDYSKAPDASVKASRSPAIDPIFDISDPESFFWTGTTHLEHKTCGFAVYISFGQAFGQMHGRKMNVHGAGAQRSDPKTGNPKVWAEGNGPQGDEVRILNYVRCVRGGNATLKTEGPKIDGSYTAGHQSPVNSQSADNMPDNHFRRIDRNGDGKISKSEFDGPPEHFSLMDKNKDGYLSEDELRPPPERKSRNTNNENRNR
jgi:hypothetical protein